VTETKKATEGGPVAQPLENEAVVRLRNEVQASLLAEAHPPKVEAEVNGVLGAEVVRARAEDLSPRIVVVAAGAPLLDRVAIVVGEEAGGVVGVVGGTAEMTLVMYILIPSHAKYLVYSVSAKLPRNLTSKIFFPNMGTLSMWISS